MNKLVPIYTKENKRFFLEHDDVPEVEAFEGFKFKTKPLVFGQSFNLLAISQTEDLVNADVQNPTDTIDLNIKLAAVYIELYDGSICKYETKDLPSSNFLFTERDPVKTGRLNFSSIFTSNKKHAGSPINIRFKVIITGFVQVDTGYAFLSCHNLESTGKEFDRFLGSKLMGFDLDINRISRTPTILTKQISVLVGLIEYSPSIVLLTFVDKDKANIALLQIKEYSKIEPKFITDKGDEEFLVSQAAHDAWVANFPFGLNLHCSYDDYEIATVNLIE